MSERMKEVTYTQYLDMVKVLPSLYKPLQKKLAMTKNSLQKGIEQVKKANEYINKLTRDITEKEPEILKLKTEIEQLNKRLSLSISIIFWTSIESCSITLAVDQSDFTPRRIQTASITCCTISGGFFIVRISMRSFLSIF